jgi:putative ABC transport system permease protein
MWVEDMRQDVVYALRSFRRLPGFASLAIATLALGIGANTAIFSVVNSVLLRPLPYKDPDRLVNLIATIPAEAPGSQPRRTSGSLGGAQLLELRSAARSLSQVGIYGPALMTFTARDLTIRLEGTRIESAITQMLGVPPLLGRVFDANDDQPGADSVVILSFGTWRSVFGGAPDILGRRVTLDGAAYAVIGVMPASFAFPTPQTQFWTLNRDLVGLTGVARANAPRRGGAMLARLADGVPLRAAAVEVDAILRAIPGGRPGVTYDLAREQDELVASVRGALVVLMVAVGFVLLIACVNVANLLLARAVAREREIAVRVALGAGRGRIVRHLLTESVLLALAGGVAGIVLARGGIQILKTLGTTMGRFDLGSGLPFPRVAEIDLDASVLGLTVIVSTAAGVFFGLAPALRHSRTKSLEVLRRGAASAPSGFSIVGRHPARGLLVVAEIAMAVMLLVGGGLLIHSFVKLANVNPGYDAADVLTFQVALPPDRYPNARVKTFADDLVARLRQLPGVQEAAFARQLPMVILTDTLSLSRSPGLSQPPKPDDSAPIIRADLRVVSQDYLTVMRIPVIQGRSFNDHDRDGQPRALLVNEAMVRSSFAGQDVIGQFVQPTRDGVPWEIVGVVRDVRQFALDRDPAPQIFADFRQWPEKEVPLFPLGPYYLLRTKGDFMQVMSSVRAIVGQLDAQAAPYNVAAMDDIVSNRIARPRMYAVLLGIFAAIGVALAAIGIYGVMAYSVSQRTREIGIRVALGAQRAQVVALVLNQSLVLSMSGIALGIAGAAAVTRYLEGFLFGLTPLDPATFIGVSVMFTAVALVAAYVPARRATRVDPLVALRYE